MERGQCARRHFHAPPARRPGADDRVAGAAGSASARRAQPMSAGRVAGAELPSSRSGLVRVLIASTFVPFIEGGGRMIVRDLARAVRERGHEVDTVEIPFLSSWDTMLEQMLAIRLMDVSDAADVLDRDPHAELPAAPSRTSGCGSSITTAAHMTCGDTPYQDLPSTPEGLGVREAIVAADNLYLRESQRIFTNSQIVADRLQRLQRARGRGALPAAGRTGALRSRPGRGLRLLSLPDHRPQASAARRRSGASSYDRCAGRDRRRSPTAPSSSLRCKRRSRGTASRIACS